MPWPICCSTWKVSRVRIRGTLRSVLSELPTDECFAFAFLCACVCALDRTETDFFQGEPLSALTTLSYSDNVDLQRSAALAFAEITEKEVREVGPDTFKPIMFLLQSHDVEVQRAASAALGNLAVNSTSSSLSHHFWCSLVCRFGDSCGFMPIVC